MTTPALIGWAAGLFEGEGWCTRDKKYCSYQLGIESTDEDALIRFQEIVGGRGRIRQRKKRKPHHKEIWQWTVGAGADVVAILHLLRPYLCLRRGARADEALKELMERRGLGVGTAASAVS